METRHICYHGWSFAPRDLTFALRHARDDLHRCGLTPGHDGPCVCRECGDSPAG